MLFRLYCTIGGSRSIVYQLPITVSTKPVGNTLLIAKVRETQKRSLLSEGGEVDNHGVPAPG